jgi:hypothetical protein
MKNLVIEINQTINLAIQFCIRYSKHMKFDWENIHTDFLIISNKIYQFAWFWIIVYSLVVNFKHFYYTRYHYKMNVEGDHLKYHHNEFIDPMLFIIADIQSLVIVYIFCCSSSSTDDANRTRCFENRSFTYHGHKPYIYVLWIK